jgi:hypothetical protein
MKVNTTKFSKKHSLFTQFIVFIGLLSCYLQTVAQENHPIRKRLKNKYDYIEYFRNNVAPARTFKDAYTLLDTLGNELFPAKFDYIHNTGYDLLEAGIEVKNKMKRGYINKNGDIIIPLQYDYVYMPNADFAIVEQNGKVGLLNKNNQIIVPITYDYITDANNNRFIVQRSGMYAFYTNTGKPVTDFAFKDVERFYDEVASVVYPNNSSSLIDTNGRLLFTPITKTAIKNTNKYFATILNTTTQKYGVIDRNGKSVIPTQYNGIELLDSISIVEKNKKVGILSNNGQLITPLVYDAIYQERGMTNRFYAKKDPLYGIIDKDNNEIIPAEYAFVKLFLKDYFVVKKSDTVFGIKNANGAIVIPEDYNFITESDDKVFCTKNNQCLILNVLDTNNNILLPKEIQFKKNKPGYFAIYQSKFQIFIQNNQYGLMDDSGQTVIPAIYEDISAVSFNGLYKVKQGGKLGIMNHNGKLLKPIQYDTVIWRKEYLSLQIKGKKPEAFSIYQEEE